MQSQPRPGILGELGNLAEPGDLAGLPYQALNLANVFPYKADIQPRAGELGQQSPQLAANLPGQPPPNLAANFQVESQARAESPGGPAYLSYKPAADFIDPLRNAVSTHSFHLHSVTGQTRCRLLPLRFVQSAIHNYYIYHRLSIAII